MTDGTILSIVIVTYNEADRIGDCLESALAVGDEVGASEVIVVDGNSTDGTTALAGTYPVTVLQTAEETISTPSTGRHVGTEYASGDYVLFVDGDTCVAEGWVPAAIERLRSDPDLVGVGGHFNDLDGTETVQEVDWLWRMMLYERAALREVGGFDPYLNSLEDIEVGFRLRIAGYRLHRLPEVVGYHPDARGLDESFRRWRQGFYFGNGEVIRKYLNRPRMLAPWLKRLRLWFGTVGWLVAGVAGTVATGPAWGAAWLATTALLLCIGFVVRDQHWVAKKVVSSLALLPAGLLWGFLRYPPAAEYPLDTVEVVAEPKDVKVTT